MGGRGRGNQRMAEEMMMAMPIITEAMRMPRAMFWSSSALCRR